MPFLEAVGPEVVVTSSGRKDFGKVGSPVFLPDKVTLDRIAEANAGTTVVRTDDNDAPERRTYKDQREEIRRRLPGFDF